MENTENGHNDNIIRPNKETAQTKHTIVTDNTIVPNTNKDKIQPDATLPYEDPAITNPEELASFPKPAAKSDAEDVENESENRLVNLKKSPVREGRNIVNTDTNPDPDGFM